MTTVNRKLIALGAAGAVALAGGGVAYAAAGSSDDDRDALLDRAAQQLNVSPERLRAALSDALGEQLDRAVDEGHLTREQADRMKEHARDGGVPFGGPPRVHHMRLGGPIDGAADYLGLSEEELRERLADGRSLAEIARAEGKSVDGLERALVAAAKKRLDDAVKARRLTDAQRDELLERLEQDVARLVNADGDERCGPGGPGGPHGFGGPTPAIPLDPPDGRDGGDRSERGPSTAPGAWGDAPGPVPAWS